MKIERTCQNCIKMCPFKDEVLVVKSCEYHTFEYESLYAKIWEQIERWKSR